jgi:UDP-N-acetylglucosamine acyltransferase
MTLSTQIHPSAVVSPDAELGEGCRVDPFAVIEAGASLGRDNHVGPWVHIAAGSRIGDSNLFAAHSCIGGAPQDLHFDHERATGVAIGNGNRFREFSTVHRATGDQPTLIGSHGLFMVNTHVAHDCVVGDHVVMTNNSVLAGFVEVHEYATLSAFVAIHQFCRVGRCAMIGAYSKIVQDVLPFVLVDGNPAKVYDANLTGLRRRGFTPAQRRHIRDAVKAIYRESHTPRSALEHLRERSGSKPCIEEMVAFIEQSERGFISRGR